MILDTEKLQLDALVNESVATYSWSGCTVSVKDRATGQEKLILHDVSGSAQAGTFESILFPRVDRRTKIWGVSGGGAVEILPRLLL